MHYVLKTTHTPLFIFDIDGTLSNAEHRLHHILFNTTLHGFERDFKPNWKQFYLDCDDDEPKPEIIHVLRNLAATNDIWFFTGRTEDVREQTLTWLNTYVMPGIQDHHVMMRPSGNSEQDYIIKEQMLYNMLDEDRNRLLGVFDDRQQVVDMWRRNGITCFQVAKGDF